MAIQFELYKTPPSQGRGRQRHTTHVWSTSSISTRIIWPDKSNSNFTDRGRRKICPRISKPLYGGAAPGRESVHLDGIGYFQIKLNSQEPITSPKLKANQIKLKANISFKADIKLKKVGKRRTSGTEAN